MVTLNAAAAVATAAAGEATVAGAVADRNTMMASIAGQVQQA